MTVMLVGLFNSGIMQLEQTVCVIMGPNICTTLTAWLLSTEEDQSDNILTAMLDLVNFAPIVALISIIVIMMAKNKKRQYIGTIVCLAVVYGLNAFISALWICLSKAMVHTLGNTGWRRDQSTNFWNDQNDY